jgi:type VI secretion system protein ImpF
MPLAMSRLNPQLQLTRSFLDRASSNPRAGEEARLADVRDALRRDLQRMLNTRLSSAAYPKSLTELEVSLANYGLPDVGGIESGREGTRERMRQIIETAIRGFEPRLVRNSVRVTLTGENQPLDRTMRFRIEGTLVVQPTERVLLETVHDPSTDQFEVRRAG